VTFKAQGFKSRDVVQASANNDYASTARVAARICSSFSNWD